MSTPTTPKFKRFREGWAEVGGLTHHHYWRRHELGYAIAVCENMGAMAGELRAPTRPRCLQCDRIRTGLAHAWDAPQALAEVAQ